MYQVDSEDANFLFLEKAESPTHISLLYLYDQSELDGDAIRFTHIREHIGKRLNSAPVFTRKIRRTPGNIDYPYWVDDDQFDLDFHLRHLALPRPGDWRQFCIQIARLHSRPLDLSRPLWEIYVIEGLDNMDGFPSNCFALYFKVHHCAMDEFTAQELLQSLHTDKPVRDQHASADQHIAHLPATAPPPMEMIVRGLLNNSMLSLRLANQSIRNIRTLSKIIARLYMRTAQEIIDGEEATASSRFSRPLSPSRVFEGGFYSLELFQKYCQQVPGATMSHAVLAVCGEATRRYLAKHQELGAQPLQALLQVNVRNAGAHALVGNRIAINQVDLHTQVSYPEGRLQAIVATNRELHSTEEVELTNFRLRSLYENLPAPLLAWLGRNSDRESSLNRRIMEGGNLGLAELVGSEHPLYLLGAKLTGFTGISPLYSGCGLMFNASTYCDRVGITFVSDRTMMADPELMSACLAEAVNELNTFLRTGRSSKPAVGKRKRKKSRPVAA